MATFKTISEAANFINSNASTGVELTLNDTICFGMGVYAYKSECQKAGITVSSTSSAFHHLDESELLMLLSWLQDNDGYLIAA